MEITGLDELEKNMKELQKALAELDGDLANVTFDPDDPASIEQAIQALNSSIDEKISGYAQNEMVAGIVEELKENGREAILERAASGRLEENDDE